jgi:hypothetical protein
MNKRRPADLTGGRHIMRRIRSAALVLLSLLSLAPPALAEKRVALVVGNDRYANLPTLQKAGNDAEAVGSTLARLGFEVILGRDLGRQGMVDKLAEFTARLDPGDTALFFYAGHGVAVGGINYLVPTDMPAATAGSEVRVRGSSIAEPDIIAEIQARGARVAVLVLDACRDNPFPRAGTRTLGNSRGLADAKPASGVFTLYSAGIGQTALDFLEPNDKNPNSVFTRVFVEKLARPGLHIADLAIEVREKVADIARTARNASGEPDPHVQTPAYYDQTIGGRIFLAGRGIAIEPGTASAAAPAAPRPDPCAEAAAHWKSVEAIGTLAVFEDHLRRFPRCVFASLAQTRIAALKAESAPSASAKAYAKSGSFACFGKADYPASWRDEASLCTPYGCNFGKMSQEACLTLAVKKGSKTVIHGNTGTTRANECWLQHSCGDLRPHYEFSLFKR